MAQGTSIEWTEATWNPVRGCSRISEGCRYCYAERMAARFAGPGHPFHGFARMTSGGPRWTGKVSLIEDSLELPLHWRQPRRIFVNSMSDLFHESLPVEAIERVFEVMQAANWHEFQVLTKRSGRLLELAPHLPWPSQVWMGVSVENDEHRYRIDDLRQVDAKVRFLSLEPLIGPLPNLDLNGIGWVIVGGESGPGCRSISADWVLDIRDQCIRARVPFFFKQWGGPRKKATGRELEGRVWNEMPGEAA